QWKRFVEVMGSPEWASEERYRDRRMMGEQYPDEVDALIVPWLKTKTKAELLELALETRLPIVPLRTVEEVLESRQLAARNFWRTETIDGRAVRMPGLPFTFTPSGGASGGLSAPLTGRLVLDLGRVAAAPGVGQWLADLGATVIKVESRTHLDSSRKGRPLIASDIGASDAGATPNLMPFFISVNRGKRSLTLDLSTDAGRSVLDRLVARADVLIENVGAGGLEHLDLGPGRLHSIRPELVVIRVSAVGQTGPEAKLAGYAPHSTAAAGLDNLCRYPGGEPVGMIATNFGDMNTAAFGSLAALAGIRSGRGGTFDLSMLESNVTHLGPQLLEHQLGHPRPVPEPDGPAEPVPALGTEDLLFDDHIRARDLVVEIPHSVLGIVPVHGVPLRGGPGFMAVRGPAPDLGEHNGEILAELGLSAEEQRVLAAAGAFDGPVCP
ncbi:MAG TPA: CoA transferase, partial [Acidimicrobiia bacterium]|nr:CoA transferase [Acidimicrobiia bacterium]